MTKSQLIAALAAKMPQLVFQDAEESVNTILKAMTTALVNGERIEIRGFGSFALNYRPSRIARNPRSGESVEVEAKYAPHFRAGKELRDSVNDSAGK